MERERGKEKIHPNQVINDALNYYIVDAFESGLFWEKGNTKAMLGIIDHLTKSGALEKGDNFPSKKVFESQKNEVLELGLCAYQALNQKKDIKDLAKGNFDPRLIAYAPQALLVYSYLPLLDNLKDIITGKQEYGFGKKLNRLQPYNAMASGEMMKLASKNIAKEIVSLVEIYNYKNVAILELGCGNASFSASVVEEFKNQNLESPFILATDLDPNTQGSAKQLFDEKGIAQSLNLMKVDMGNFSDLNEAAKRIGDRQVVIHIGYILHENRKLAIDALTNLTKVFRGKEVVFAFSEYFTQEKITPEIPLWFQTLHEITQDLFNRDEFVEFVKSHGLTQTGELSHNIRKDTGEIINSTTFWKI